MSMLPAITAVLAGVFALALFEQWLDRRRPYQLVWAVGMLSFGIAVACEAVAGALGWNATLYRTWYLTGAVWTAGWLGLGSAFLLGRTRFGYAFALSLFLAGLFTLLAQRRDPVAYADAGPVPLLYFIAALILALAVAVETYFQNERWPWLATVAVVGASLLSLVLVIVTPLPAPGYALDPRTGIPTGALFPGAVRLLTPFMNVTGAFALLLGALFSAYVFMPKRRVLPYSLDPLQPGDIFLFNLVIAPVAIAVNFVASLPAAFDALLHGRLNSRVPATLLIALGAFVPSITDSLNRFGSTELFQLGKLLSAVFLFTGFLVSIEVFREIRIPFTGRVLVRRAPRGEAQTDRHSDREIERQASSGA